jgi:hypothetical protein
MGKSKVMNYLEIPDWKHLRKRYMAYWAGEVSDNAIITHIQNPNPLASKTPSEPWMTDASDSKYLNPEKLYKLKKWRSEFWNWHTDLFKYMTPSYGPNVFIGFCGAKVAFGSNTVWHEPVISSVDEFHEIHFDQDNIYWKALLENIDYMIKNHINEHHIGLPDFGGPTDWISSVMGTENFLFACVEHPDAVRDFALRLTRECNEAFDIAYRIIGEANDGSVNWMPIWSEECLGTVQDDMAINFSPQMYAEIFLPALKVMSGHTKNTVLHWHDGCAHHLDNILSIDEIDLIQFGHDPNTGPFRNFISQMQNIQASGKKLFISCVDAGDVEFFISHLDPKGLMMIINTANDQESATMQAKIHKWTSIRQNA